MKILLLQDQEEAAQKITFFIEGTYGGTVVVANNIAKAIKTIEESKKQVGQGIDLMVYDLKIGSLSELRKFWEISENIPCLFCVAEQTEKSTGTLPKNVVGVVDRSHFIENFEKSMAGLVEKHVLGGNISEVPEMGQVRIKTQILLSVCPLKGDVYIRLSKTKFIKLFTEGDKFEREDLEKYTIKKGVEYLYIRQEQCAEFIKKYKADIDKILASQELSIDDVSKVSDSIHETVQELGNRIGYTKEVQELAKMQVNLTLKAIGKSPELADLLSKIKKTDGKYISSHSTLCAYLACAIASQLEWNSTGTFHKLNLAAFLHDITLENDELAKLDNLRELAANGSKFTPEELKAFQEHPLRASEISKGFQEVPPDVDTIILQHHERPNGSGFPRGLTHAYIAPLSAVFIVAHDLAKYILKNGPDFDPEDFVSTVRNDYSSSQFRKILAVLEDFQEVKKLEGN